MMDNLRTQLKLFLQKSYLARSALDLPTKEKQKQINEFLERIKELLANNSIKMKDLCQNYDDMIKIFQQLYDQLKYTNKELEKNKNIIQDIRVEMKNIGIDINTVEGQYKDIEDQIHIFHQQLDDKEKEYKKAVGMCFIPFAGFYYISRCADIQNKEIPAIKRRIEDLIKDKVRQEKIKEEKNYKNNSLIYQMKTLQIVIDDLLSKKQLITQQITQKREEIADNINQKIYYTILQEKLENYLTHGDTLDQVLILLDKEPELIHFEDQVYFDIMKEYYDHPHDKVFEKYIMDAKKQIDKN